MAKYIIKRLLIAAATIFVLMSITFFVVQLLPGDPFTGAKVNPESVVQMRAYYGLDKPLYEQYFIYIKNIFKGDFGYSFAYRSRQVSDIIKTAFPYSLDLGIRSIVVAMVGGLVLGIIAAFQRGKAMDSFTMVLAIIGTSVPSFVIGAFIQYFFAVKLRWFPVAQYDTVWHTVLPTVALSLGMLASIAKYTRTSMLEVIETDYVKTADAKGLSKLEIIVKHQVRNALMPIVTLLGPMAASVITGTFVVENIFAIPGLGRHYVTSIQNLDYTLIIGLTIFFGIFLVCMNLVVDLIYGLIDPRIKLQ